MYAPPGAVVTVLQGWHVSKEVRFDTEETRKSVALFQPGLTALEDRPRVLQCKVFPPRLARESTQ